MRGIQLISSSMGGGFATNKYQFVLRGTDLEEVQEERRSVKTKLLLDPAFVNPDLSIKADDPKLEVTVSEHQAEKLGLTPSNDPIPLQNAYAGGSIGKIEKGSEEYKVYSSLTPQFQKNTAALSKLYLKTPTGESIPLKAVANWNESVGLQNIQHLDLLSSITLSFDVAKEVPIKEAFEKLKNVSSQTLPGSVSGKLEGVGEMVDSTASRHSSSTSISFSLPCT